MGNTQTQANSEAIAKTLFRFPGVIVTTYHMTKVSNGEPLNDDDLKTDGIKVRFKETGADDGDKDVFLCDITEENNGYFVASYLTPETAAQKLHDEAGDKHLLFCVHGHNTEASEWMASVTEARDSGFFKRNYLIPVTWPLRGQTTLYGPNLFAHAPPAGQGMEDFVNKISNHLFPRKSLMTNSLGNHVVFNHACKDGIPDVQFDNIFMVGADVPFDIFQKTPRENYWLDVQKENFGNKTKKARNLIGMLAKGPDGKPKGKIVVTYTIEDIALQMSNVVHSPTDANRLGRVSAGGYYKGGWWWTSAKDKWGRDDSRIHHEFKDYIKSVDVTDFATKTKYGHGYQFAKESFEKVYDQYVLPD